MSRTPQSVFDAIAAQRAQRKPAVMAEIAVTEQHDHDIGAEIAEIAEREQRHNDGCDCHTCVEREAIDEIIAIIANRIHRGRW